MLAVFLFSGPVQASKIPPILKKVEEKYKKAKTVKAKFHQVNHLVAYDRKKKSSGELFIKRPNRVKWVTKDPDQNLFVSNGEKFWFYTPPFDEDSRGQVIIRDSNKVQSQLMNQLLMGSFEFENDSVEVIQYRKDAFILKPKKGTAATVEKAWIFLSKKDQFIHKVVLEHYPIEKGKKGNWSEISLDAIELGVALDSDLFEFEVPPKTDVMR